MKKAIIFGAIGTLVETSKMQRNAFNQAFSEAGLDWEWSEDTYIQLLKKSGGRNRISDYAEAQGITVDANELHRRKTQIFNEMMVSEGLKPRPGVMETISHALAAGVKLGFATTTSQNNIQAIFIALDGALQRSMFDFIGSAETVTAPKPDPEIYHRAMDEMGVTPSECIAIEDTAVSMKSALAAGIDCIAFPGAYTEATDFEASTHIVAKLDPMTLRIPRDDDDNQALSA